jgi:NAD(P)-dependent dehydrogenase (short-subunit alcohol dehydrogenase family)/catechol 2,3-dioxygenase-like lactoylglutathione lyase family enzyme
MTLHNQHIALITGASRGLGLALARELADRGWSLIVDARGAAALEAARVELAGRTRVVAIPGDISDPAHQRALAEAARELGGLDAVVNNASILGPSPQPQLLDYPLDVLEQVYRVNVIAPLALLQAVRPSLKLGARIVDITSDAGVEAYPGWGGYGSSKAALEQLSAILAAENPDLRVYWVDPGDMRTQMHQEAFPNEDISDRPPPEESVPVLIELLEGDLPSGRYKAHDLGGQGGAADGVRELRVALTVEDFDQAVRLYRDGFGLPVEQAWEAPDGRVVILGAGRATLELVDRAQAEYIDRIEVGERVAGPVRLAFEVPEIEAFAAALEDSGAEALNQAVLTPWGHRNLRLRAPDGMQITLFQLPAADEAEVQT